MKDSRLFLGMIVSEMFLLFPNVSSGQQVTSFTLVNANTEQTIQTITSNTILNLATLASTNLNIRANTSPGTVGRVTFALTGTQTRYHTETGAPYALFGDVSGNYAAWIPLTGNYTLKATPYTSLSGGSAGSPLTITFTVINQSNRPPLVTKPTNISIVAGQTFSYQVIASDPEGTALVYSAGGLPAGLSINSNSGLISGTVSSSAGIYNTSVTVRDQPGSTAVTSFVITVSAASAAQQVTSFTLLNADNGQAIQTLTSNSVLNLSTLPSSNLNIRANTNPSTVGRVVFALSGTQSRNHTETGAPYALFGASSGSYGAWTPATGTYTLKATPYSSSTGGLQGIALTVAFTVVNQSNQPVHIAGEAKKWHRVTVTFNGPLLSENGSPNPFLDYRLEVTFRHSSGKNYRIPGYFAADGQAAETGSTSGNKWRVHFVPDETGTWNFVASFRRGNSIAINNDLNAGVPEPSINAVSGQLNILPTNKQGRDLRGKGVLKYTGQRLLRFTETGEYFIKAGADSPENFLAYEDFDNTPNSGSLRKTWSPHIKDWISGNPTWKGGKGKGIIGAINYLSNKGMNSFSFLTMNINGDDKNVFPYLTSSNFTRMDVSKLDQWEIIFEYAQTRGMYLHFKMQETENNNLLDGGNLGTQRKLYYRELVARFSHHLALNWNLGEENTQTDLQRKAMAAYLYQLDPYKHPIVIHTYPGQQEQVYRPLLGNASNLTGVSIQTSPANVYAETRKWVEASASAAKKWIVANDEQGPYNIGVAADAEYPGNRGTAADNSESIRKDVLWGNLMAGGAGVEYYFGYSSGETDLTAQDFRSREKSWTYAKLALDFFKTYVPVEQLVPLNNVSSGWSLGKAGNVYVVYLKNGGTSNITLPAGSYSVNWFNPRTGQGLLRGSVGSLSAGTVSVGTPPSDPLRDWVILIQNNAIMALTQGTDMKMASLQRSVPEQRPAENVVNVYPTVMSNGEFINVEMGTEGVADFSMADAYGRMVNKFTFKGNIQARTNSLVPGVYYIRVRTAHQTITRKILIRD